MNILSRMSEHHKYLLKCYENADSIGAENTQEFFRGRLAEVEFWIRVLQRKQNEVTAQN